VTSRGQDIGDRSERAPCLGRRAAPWIRGNSSFSRRRRSSSAGPSPSAPEGLDLSPLAPHDSTQVAVCRISLSPARSRGGEGGVRGRAVAQRKCRPLTLSPMRARPLPRAAGRGGASEESATRSASCCDESSGAAGRGEERAPRERRPPPPSAATLPASHSRRRSRRSFTRCSHGFIHHRLGSGTEQRAPGSEVKSASIAGRRCSAGCAPGRPGGWCPSCRGCASCACARCPRSSRPARHTGRGCHL
jgi:hypothetical protein